MYSKIIRLSWLERVANLEQALHAFCTIPWYPILQTRYNSAHFNSTEKCACPVVRGFGVPDNMSVFGQPEIQSPQDQETLGFSVVGLLTRI